MTTIADDVVNRLTALEASIGAMAAGIALPVEFTELRHEVEELRARLFGGQKGLFQAKDLLPEVLGNDYRNQWRIWSYKARDCLAYEDERLRSVLEEVESKPSKLTPEFLAEKAISVQAPVRVVLGG